MQVTASNNKLTSRFENNAANLILTHVCIQFITSAS